MILLWIVIFIVILVVLVLVFVYERLLLVIFLLIKVEFLPLSRIAFIVFGHVNGICLLL